MEAVSGAFREVLEQHRAEFNQLYRNARVQTPSLDADDFLEHLRSAVQPAVCAVASGHPGKAVQAARGLYRLSLQLCGSGVLGRKARHACVNDAWRRVLPALPALVAADAANTAAALTNAVHNMAAQPGARPEQWMSEMSALGALCDTPRRFHACGAVVAWRCGMAHLRDAALRAAAELPPGVAYPALGLAPPAGADRLGDDIRRIRAAPWLDPATALRNAPPAPAATMKIVGHAGAFRGFGGDFLRPPAVRQQDGQLCASDGLQTWALFADVFGTAFVRSGMPPFTDKDVANSRGNTRVLPDGTVSCGGILADLDGAHARTAAFDGNTLAVTIAASHHVLLLARV